MKYTVRLYHYIDSLGLYKYKYFINLNDYVFNDLLMFLCVSNDVLGISYENVFLLHFFFSSFILYTFKI